MPKSSKAKKQPQADVQIEGNVSGDGIVIGNNNTVNNTTVIQPESLPEIHDTIGSIPPASADTYVYRGSVEDEIRAALRKGGISAIVGLHAPGGTGKTELATRIAQEVRAGQFDFEDVLWVNVNEKSAPDTLNEMLRLCGLQIQPNAGETDKKAELHHFFLNQKLLVILDDVRATAMQGLKDLLPPAPCAALITSRIQQMAGVREFALDQMTPEQAREVFVNSLGEALVQAEEQTVQKLAERCRNIPLALEIAARNILQKKSFASPVANYFERVERNFEALKMHGGERWDMRFIFDISYDDLTETDREYFRALAVFAPSGFSPDAAAHIWTALSEGEGRMDEILSRFINLSLVIPVAGDFERYRLHDLLDEYATLKLRENNEQDARSASLAGWLINLFDEHYTDDFDSAPKVGLEYENLAKMAGWALASEKADLLALLATKPRNWLYNYFRELEEWLNWLEFSLKIGIPDKGLEANVLQAIGDVQQFRDDRDAALESYNQALNLFRQVGDKLGEANVLAALSRMLVRTGKIEEAEREFLKIIQMRQAIDDLYSEGADLGNFAIALMEAGQKEKAKEYATKARVIFEKIQLPAIVEMMDSVITACNK